MKKSSEILVYAAILLAGFVLPYFCASAATEPSAGPTREVAQATPAR